MSYMITILVPPVAPTDAELWDSVAGLRDLQGPRAAVLHALHDRLVARFPCITTLDDDKVDDGVWSDGPLINNFGHRAATLGLSQQVPEVLSFVVNTAKELGLVVLDPQDGTIYRPGGAPRPTNASTFGKSDVRKLLRAGLDPTMKELGFRWTRGVYVRDWSGGFDSLGWGLADYRPIYDIGPFATLRIDAIEELIGPHVGFSKPEYAKQAFTINVCGFRAFEDGPETLRRSDEQLETPDQVRTFAAALGMLVRERIDPFWRSLRTPSDLLGLPAGWRRFWSQPVQLHDVALAFLCAPLPEQMRIEGEALAAFPPGDMHHEQIRSLIADLHTRRGGV